MKFQKPGALLALCMACSFWASAQNHPTHREPVRNQQRIFNDLPNKLSLRVNSLETLLDLPVGATVNTTIANNFLLSGTVVSKSDPNDPAVKSIVVKSNQRKDATFTFSRIRNSNGTISYAGRMLSRNAADALEIVQEGNAYVLRKKDFGDLLNE